MVDKLVVFNMDGTLLADRLIIALADSFGFRKKLETIMGGSGPKHLRVEKAADTVITKDLSLILPLI